MGALWILLILSTTQCAAMRVVLPRVKSASVSVEGAVVSSIRQGVMALVGLHEGDTDEDLRYCAKKLCATKLWPNDDGKPWRKSVKQLDLEVLLVSQFTLCAYADLSKPPPATHMLTRWPTPLRGRWGCQQQEACSRLQAVHEVFGSAGKVRGLQIECGLRARSGGQCEGWRVRCHDGRCPCE